MKKQMSVDDLRKSVDTARAMQLIETFNGESNLTALTTLACSIGLLLGAESKDADQLLASMTAVSFIMHDAAQLAKREGGGWIHFGDQPEAAVN